MHPQRLALVHDDRQFGFELCQFLREQGIGVEHFDTADALWASPGAWSHDFYIFGGGALAAPEFEAVSRLRRHSAAGVLALWPQQPACAESDALLAAGADAQWWPPLPNEQILINVKAVHRRARPPVAAPSRETWRLDVARRRLIAPGGELVRLSVGDVVVLECLLQAQGQPVSHRDLAQRLGLHGRADLNLLHASIYRLRRRIAEATPALAPFQVKSGVGYALRARLARV